MRGIINIWDPLCQVERLSNAGERGLKWIHGHVSCRRSRTLGPVPEGSVGSAKGALCSLWGAEPRSGGATLQPAVVLMGARNSGNPCPKPVFLDA